MKIKLALWAAAISGMVLCRPAMAADNTTSADTALALRLESLAHEALAPVQMPGTARSQPYYRQATSLLEAAHRLDPAEPRYLVLLNEALEALGDSDAQRRVLTQLIQLRPQDRTSQIQLVALYLSRMQTVDKQIAYLTDLIKRDSVPPEVRSHFAVLCAGLLWQQGKANERSKMLDEALKFNPLNIVALRTKYDLSLATSTPAERMGLLVGLLQANPQQSMVMLDLARELAGVGAVSESVQWYRRVDALSGAPDAGAAPPALIESRDAAWQLEYAAEQFLADQFVPAQQRLDAILAASPDFYPALIVRYLIEKQQQGSRQVELRTRARNVLISRLKVAQDALRRSATTQAAAHPATTMSAVKPGQPPLPLPDVAADAQAFAKSSNELIQNYYLLAIDDLTWFEVFIDGNPAEAQKLLDHRIALTEKRHASATTEEQKAWSKGARIFETRVQGWIFLLQNKPKEAEVKLSAAAPDDPLAALGLVRAYAPDQRAQAKAAAQKLLESHTAGVLAAIIYADVRPLGVKMSPAAQAPVVKAAVAKLPIDWLSAPQRPDQFMSLRVDPVLRRPLRYADPVLVRVTLSNTGRYDLTIGADGLVSAGMVFSVGTVGLERLNFPNVAVGVLREQILLKPGQSTSTVVRLDQSGLAQFLRERPLPMIQLTAFAMPFGIASEGMIRDAFPLRLLDIAKTAIQPGGDRTDQERMRNLDLLAAIRAYVEKKPADLEQDIQDSKIAADPNPTVRGWAMYVSADYVEAKRAATVPAMLKDSAWQVRLLGIAAAGKLPADQRKALLADIAANDPEPMLKDYASAIREQPTQPPVTRPAAPARD